jgi:putative glutamine amidotransferase
MPRPRIGITTDCTDLGDKYELFMDYVTAVEQAGGLPLPLPFGMNAALIPEILDNLDGLLFTGGDDLDPAAFGQTRHPKAEPIHPGRQRFELALLGEADKRGMPILGICLGSQLMNVHRGGSLIQFLPDHSRESPLEHRRLELRSRRHPATLVGDSSLRSSLNRTELDVNTAHKQAIDRLGRGLRVIARAPDGIIEGVEDPSGPLFLAVQWHPERLWQEADHLSVLRLLIDRGRNR